jgi:hypothetical protein
MSTARDWAVVFLNTIWKSVLNSAAVIPAIAYVIKVSQM